MHIVPLRTSPGPGIVVYMDKTTNTGRPWGAVFLSALLIPTMGTIGQAEAGLDKKTATYKAPVRNFDIFAFGNEYTGRRYNNVRKWRQPIRVGIEGKYPKYFGTFVLQHIRDLRKLTGHSIRLYYSPSMHKEGRLAPDFDRNKST